MLCFDLLGLVPVPTKTLLAPSIGIWGIYGDKYQNGKKMETTACLRIWWLAPIWGYQSHKDREIVSGGL